MVKKERKMKKSKAPKAEKPAKLEKMPEQEKPSGMAYDEAYSLMENENETVRRLSWDEDRHSIEMANVEGKDGKVCIVESDDDMDAWAPNPDDTAATDWIVAPRKPESEVSGKSDVPSLDLRLVGVRRSGWDEGQHVIVDDLATLPTEDREASDWELVFEEIKDDEG